MVELHGWATIRENFTVDNENLHLEQIINDISKEIENFGASDASLRIAYSNGEAILTATKFTNHLSNDIVRIIDLFRKIAIIAPGSYGLLYLHNDENTTEFNNAFQVYVLARGSVTLQEDPFLSPYIPTVEAPSIDDGG